MTDAACSVCGAALSVHQVARGGVCDRFECLSRSAVQNLAARKERAKAAARERLRAESGGGEIPRMTIAVLPAYSRSIVPQPKARRRAFRAHLEEIVGEAFAAEEPLPEPAPDRGGSSWMGAACGVCRGYCCRLIHGKKGLVDVKTVRRFLERRPELTPEEVVAAYEDRVPDTAHERSCIYHAEEGCSLDRDMRSETCNNYLCEGITEVEAEHRPGGREGIYLAAFEDGRIVRSGRHPG